MQEVIARIEPGGAIFYEAHRAGFDDAGFAYLNGPLESPRFSHLGGPWYSWSATW